MNKDELVKEILKRQAEIQVEPKNRMQEEMDKIEPFSWMDEEIRQQLSQTLSEEEMQKLDKSARGMFTGRNIMSKRLTNAIRKVMKD